MKKKASFYLDGSEKLEERSSFREIKSYVQKICQSSKRFLAMFGTGVG